jgi:hypothetical protein
MSVRKLGLAACVATAALAAAGSASADALFDFSAGAMFTVYGTNAPNTFNDVTGVSFALGTQSIDGDALQLTISTYAGPGNSEWIVFDFQAPAGTLIAGDPTQDWQLGVTDVPFAQDLLFEHYYVAWGSNGTLFGPTDDQGSNTSIETNPITGSGDVFGSDVMPALLESYGQLEGDVDPFADTLDLWGIGSSGINEFEIGGLYAPAAAPEPATLTLLGAGLLGAGIWRRRKHG